MARTTWVLGFTGAVGAGCTTAVKELGLSKGFRKIRLSDVIRQRWADVNGDVQPTREQLQQLGDELRAQEGVGALVRHALEGVDVGEGTEPIAIDGVRNLGEVEELQDRFGHRFLLVAVLAPFKTRWSRVAYEYDEMGLTESNFRDDDARDQGEKEETGQQVGLCVDAADAIINNSTGVGLEEYKKKVVEYAEVLTREVDRAPTEHEIRMYTATSQSHSSRCLKRHVGAIVVGRDGEIVGVGYNENPLSMAPCVDEEKYQGRCFRDIVRNRQFESLVAQETRCPVCSKPIASVVGPPWTCASCASNGVATNLEPFFFPERAMNWCTAIHAEDRALRLAGDRAVGGMIYTTTFPCFGCAERIISAGIRTVLFTEPYPDVFSSERLLMAKVEVRQFEGVRSSAFERVFASNKPR